MRFWSASGRPGSFWRANKASVGRWSCRFGHSSGGRRQRPICGRRPVVARLTSYCHVTPPQPGAEVYRLEHLQRLDMAQNLQGFHPPENRMSSKKFLPLLVSLGLLASFPAHAEDIVIGMAGPITGGEAAFGRQMLNGVQMAVEDLNASGGVLGKHLVLEVADDACDPKQARSVAEKMAGRKIPVVIGHYCSSTSIPASEPYEEGNVLQITPASTNPLFTERKMWNVFRMCGRDDQQGGVAADYLARNFRGKNIAILNDKSTYGKGLADQTRLALNKAGIQEKLFESYNKGDKDFNAIVSRLKRDNIGLVYVGGYHQESGLLVRQMRDQGLQTVLMGGDALNDKEFSSIAGAGGAGTLFTFGPDPRKKPTANAIVERFKQKGIDPEGYTLYSYAAVQVWAQAAAKAGGVDAKKLAQTIKAGDWDTVLGKVAFDNKGDVKAIDYAVYRIDAQGNASETAASN